MLFCGIDLHSNNSVVLISDENDKVLFSKRLPNKLEEIRAALSPYRAELFGVVVGLHPDPPVSPNSVGLKRVPESDGRADKMTLR